MDPLIIFGAKYLFIVVAIIAMIAAIPIPKEKQKSYLLTAIFAIIIAFILRKLASSIYFDPRPFTHGVEALIPHVADNGFPSDHTVVSALLAFLTLTVNRNVGMLLLVLAFLVGASRVLAGVHSPVDILSGFIIGGLSVIAAYWIQKRITHNG